jgi:hypothetical protein
MPKGTGDGHRFLCSFLGLCVVLVCSSGAGSPTAYGEEIIRPSDPREGKDI